MRCAMIREMSTKNQKKLEIDILWLLSEKVLQKVHWVTVVPFKWLNGKSTRMDENAEPTKLSEKILSIWDFSANWEN